MRDFEQNPKPDKTLQLSMKWRDAFEDLLDEIYFQGYSQQLFEEDNKAYQKEYFYFISLYDEPPPEFYW